MSTKFGLGRGLSALIPGAPAPVTPPTPSDHAVLTVPTERIHANPLQPRQTFDEMELAQLAASIRSHGILQPLIVTVRADGAYELVAGERRLRASRLAGLATVPIIVRAGAPDDREKLELALIENIQRADLNPIERALAYQQLQREFGLTQEEVAARVGVSRSGVAHALRLLALPADMQDALRSGALSEGHAKLLAGMEDAAEQRAWFDRILEQRLPVAAVAAGHRAPRSPANASASSHGDPNLRAKELELQRALGVRVAITPQGSGGKVVLTYADPEELHGIIRAMTRGR
ncbi:ParB/RepB/Spo0J family partition protein [Candidatus Uhrbacteria bacterium]|nr:ParB/RepB/Spo0J family partition protein [Candidatus Uhrbacteria bacterium]